MVRTVASGANVPLMVDSSSWTRFATTSNADFYEVEPSVLAVVPVEGTTDDAATARESVAAQLAYLRPRGQRAGVIVMMDRVAQQSGDARAVYREQPDPTFQVCFALVGSTAFGRAVASIFVGINPPRVPTRLFATFEEALTWVRTTVHNL